MGFDTEFWTLPIYGDFKSISNSQRSKKLIEVSKSLRGSSFSNPQIEKILSFINCRISEINIEDLGSKDPVVFLINILEARSSIYRSADGIENKLLILEKDAIKKIIIGIDKIDQLQSILKSFIAKPQNEYLRDIANSTSLKVLKLTEEKINSLSLGVETDSETYLQNLQKIKEIISAGSKTYSAAIEIPKAAFEEIELIKESLKIILNHEVSSNSVDPSCKKWVDEKPSNKNSNFPNNEEFTEEPSSIKVRRQIISATLVENPSFYSREIVDFVLPEILEFTKIELEKLENDKEENQINGLDRLIKSGYRAYQIEKEEFLTDQILQESDLIIDFITRNEAILQAKNTEHNKSKSLLSKIIGGVPNAYSVKILNSAIAACDNINGDLLGEMLDDDVISSNPDLTKTFGLLVKKQIKKPSEAQWTKLLTHNRCTSGNNASKLALEFFYNQNDLELITHLNSQECSSKYPKEKEALEKFLAEPSYSASRLAKNIECLIVINRDNLLEKLLKNKNFTLNNLSDEDNDKILKVTILNKYIHTFKILIEAGFNPLKHPENILNCFALACETQGLATIEPYLKAIEEKFGKDKVSEIVTEVAEEKSALDRAIEGEGYVEVIKFLLNYQPKDITTNYLGGIKKAASKGHAGVLELLLRNEENLTPKEIWEIYVTVKKDGDFAVIRTFIEYLKVKYPTSEYAELCELSKQKEANLTDEDFFKICQTSGRKTLELYLKARSEFKLEDFISSKHVETDSTDYKTPLYCAISSNGYSSLVKFLLEKGADVNDVGSSGSKIMDAATLAIKQQHPITLSEVLAVNLNSESILRVVKELVRPENNKMVLTKSFILGLKIEHFNLINWEDITILLKRSLEPEYNADLTVIEKMRIVVASKFLERRGLAESFIGNVIDDAFKEGSDTTFLSNLIHKFDIKTLLSSIKTSSDRNSLLQSQAQDDDNYDPLSYCITSVENIEPKTEGDKKIKGEILEILCSKDNSRALNTNPSSPRAENFCIPQDLCPVMW